MFPKITRDNALAIFLSVTAITYFTYAIEYAFAGNTTTMFLFASLGVTVLLCGVTSWDVNRSLRERITPLKYALDKESKDSLFSQIDGMKKQLDELKKEISTIPKK